MIRNSKISRILVFLMISYILTMLISSCDISEKKSTTENKPVSNKHLGSDSVNKSALTLTDFDFVKKGIARKFVEQRLGKPFKDIGSGLWIYVYKVEDNYEITLYFGPDEKLTKSTIKDKNGEIKNMID